MSLYVCWCACACSPGPGEGAARVDDLEAAHGSVVDVGITMDSGVVGLGVVQQQQGLSLRP